MRAQRYRLVSAGRISTAVEISWNEETSSALSEEKVGDSGNEEYTRVSESFIKNNSYPIIAISSNWISLCSSPARKSNLSSTQMGGGGDSYKKSSSEK